MLASMGGTPVRAAAAAAIVAAMSLGGCTGGNRPAMCDSFDAVRRSAETVTHANVTETGLAALTGEVNQLKANLDQFAADAEVQFQPQIDALNSATDDLSTSVTRAKVDPGAGALRQVRSAVAGVTGAAN